MEYIEGLKGYWDAVSPEFLVFVNKLPGDIFIFLTALFIQVLIVHIKYMEAPCSVQERVSHQSSKLILIVPGASSRPTLQQRPPPR